MTDKMEDRIIMAQRVAERFVPQGEVPKVREYGNGNINDTYLVLMAGGANFILQRINTHVFTHPKWIVHNLRTYANHVDAQISLGDDSRRRWDVPRILATHSGEDYYVGADGSFWRGISFVPYSRSYDTVLDKRHAWEAGYALGRFQSLVNDISTDQMYDTLEGFHITPQYVERYDEIRSRKAYQNDSPEINYCHKVIADRRGWASVLEDAKNGGDLRMRIIHGDPKINNFMICDQTGQAVSVIDLDTVKPGLVHYDIGDCLRSSCNPLGEETQDFDQVYFDVGLARAILEGYISVAHQFLTYKDYDYLWDAICLIPFELGLRFFTDHMAGDQYFKVRYRGHNLERALVQFKLLESIEVQEGQLKGMISDLRQAPEQF